MEILDLVLKHKWYDMIKSMDKTEEYREITHYWMRRLFLPGDYFYLWKPLKKYGIDAKDVKTLKKQVYSTAEMRFCDFKYVRFRRGYTNTTITFAIKEITIGMGNPAWGAPEGKEVFIIKLGERYDEQSKQLHEFKIKGHTVMAYSRKDAIKKLKNER